MCLCGKPVTEMQRDNKTQTGKIYKSVTVDLQLSQGDHVKKNLKLFQMLVGRRGKVTFTFLWPSSFLIILVFRDG